MIRHNFLAPNKSISSARGKGEKVNREIITELFPSASQRRELVLTVGWLNTWHCRVRWPACASTRTHWYYYLRSRTVVNVGSNRDVALGQHGIPSIEEASVVNRFIGSRRTRAQNRTRVRCTRIQYTRFNTYFRAKTRRAEYRSRVLNRFIKPMVRVTLFQPRS